MSPSLFNIYMKEVVDKVHAAKMGVKMGGVCFSVLAFADDLVVIGKIWQHLAKNQTKYFINKLIYYSKFISGTQFNHLILNRGNRNVDIFIGRDAAEC